MFLDDHMVHLDEPDGPNGAQFAFIPSYVVLACFTSAPITHFFLLDTGLRTLGASSELCHPTTWFATAAPPERHVLKSMMSQNTYTSLSSSDTSRNVVGNVSSR